MSVIESAKRILVEWDKVRISFQVDQVEPESVRLARFVLALFERLTPDAVEAAERLTENQYVKGQAGNIYLAMALMQTDHRTLALQFALPIIAQLRDGT